MKLSDDPKCLYVFFRDNNTGNLDFIRACDMISRNIKIEPRFFVALLHKSSICEILDKYFDKHGKA